MRLVTLANLIALIATCPVLEGQTSSAGSIRPAYNASAPRQQTVSVMLQFAYSRQDFSPPAHLHPAGAIAQSYNSPEETMLTRASAMGRQNYELWFSTWDTEAQSLFLKDDATQPAKEERTRQWRSLFSVSEMVLFKRIEFGGFVILTYQMLDSQGRNVGIVELPSVFRKVDGRWLGTQQMAASPLLIESPWMLGRDSATREVK